MILEIKLILFSVQFFFAGALLVISVVDFADEEYLEGIKGLGLSLFFFIPGVINLWEVII